jgi:hypothetical protein
MPDTDTLDTPLARIGGIDADLGGRVYMARLRTVGDVIAWLTEGHELADIPRLADGEAGVLARALLAFRAGHPTAREALKIEWLEEAAKALPPEPKRRRKGAPK